MTPQTMYAKTSDDVWIAYQVIGDVARDLVLAVQRSRWTSSVTVIGH